MVRLSGSRLLAQQTALLSRRQGILTAAEYARIRAKLERRESAVLKRAAEREKRLEEERSRVIGAKLAAAEAARAEKRRLTNAKRRIRKLKNANVVLDLPNAEHSHLFTVENLFKPLSPGTYRFVVISGGTIVEDKTIHRGDRYTGDFTRQIMTGSDQFIWDDGDHIVVMTQSKIQAATIEQMFRDGISHCVFTPIRADLERRFQESESAQMKRKLKARLAKACELEVTYAAGVPVSCMESVAKAVGYAIRIKYHFQPHDEEKALFVFNEKGWRSGVMWFDNTRENHVDVSHVTKTMPTEVSEEEMRTLYSDAKAGWDNHGEFFRFQKLENGVPRKLFTLNQAYTLKKTEDEIAMREFSESVNLRKYQFNATANPSVNEFIKSGRIINSWPTKLFSGRVTGHVDLSKAYSRFDLLPAGVFNGFLGVIHSWGTGSFDSKFISEHIGIYSGTVDSSATGELEPLLRKLGLKGTIVLPSVEILYYMSLGVKFNLTHGVWGSRTEFEFSPDMLENRRYCNWSGRLSMEYPNEEFSFYASSEWAAHLKSQYGEAVRYWPDGRCDVMIPRKNVYTTHHILAFITAYTRINMVEAMRKFEIRNLRCVVMDGIYYEGKAPDLEGFAPKPIKKQEYYSSWYSSSIALKEYEWINWKPIQFANNTLLTGQGGSGKTYQIMTHGQYNKILFVSPSHVLGADVNKKYGVAYTTINKLIGIECQPFHTTNYYPPVVLVDEVTQLSNDWVERVFREYPESLILLAGDLDSEGRWFQCRGGTGREGFTKLWKPHGVDIVNVAGDRRSRDSSLAELKLQIRDVMRGVFVNGDSGEEHVMKAWAKANLEWIPYDLAIPLFNEGDTWIAGTHEINNMLLTHGIVSGWYKKGGHIEKEEKAGFEKRGSFTIHAYQGKTVETGKIFISLNGLFEYAMLYTAVSRAVNFSQLVFVS